MAKQSSTTTTAATANKSDSKDWPIRWDLLMRYQLIEIIAMWEGRLTTNHLSNSFGIGRQQASKDINIYLRDIGPDNLVYDKYLKGYKPTESFSPKVTRGASDEYLQLLLRNQDISSTFETLDLDFPNTELIRIPGKTVESHLMRSLVSACRFQQRIDVDYVSMSNPRRDGRIITPHTLFHNGLRWYVRAYCEKHRDFRDFALTRFRGEIDSLGSSELTAADDEAWNTWVKIKIKPDPRLKPVQKRVIAEDFGMTRGVLTLNVRGPLVQYTLKRLQIEPEVIQGKASAQQIILDNLADIQAWLF